MTKSNDYIKGGLQKRIYEDDEVVERNCPLCDNRDYEKIHKERGAIGIVKCKNCKLIYVNPMVKSPEKNYHGKEAIYYEEASLIFKGVLKSHRYPNYIADLKIIENIKPEGSFLDIGTNVGFFLSHALGKKWKLTGIEPSPALSEMARKYFGLDVRNCYLHEACFEEDYFDIVTMTDVLEHISEPRPILKDIRRIMKKDGILFIKVPNGSYNLMKLWLAKKMGKLSDYDIFDSYEHVTHYTHNTLKKLLESEGFAVKKVLIGRPIQLPVWHKYVGHYYEYPSPWILDVKNHVFRLIFYFISRVEYWVRLGRIGCFAPNIIMIAVKNED